jgi:hypothetical protein
MWSVLARWSSSIYRGTTTEAGARPPSRVGDVVGVGSVATRERIRVAGRLGLQVGEHGTVRVDTDVAGEAETHQTAYHPCPGLLALNCSNVRSRNIASTVKSAMVPSE